MHFILGLMGIGLLSIFYLSSACKRTITLPMMWPGLLLDVEFVIDFIVLNIASSFSTLSAATHKPVRQSSVTKQIMKVFSKRFSPR